MKYSESGTYSSLQSQIASILYPSYVEGNSIDSFLSNFGLTLVLTTGTSFF